MINEDMKWLMEMKNAKNALHSGIDDFHRSFINPESYEYDESIFNPDEEMGYEIFASQPEYTVQQTKPSTQQMKEFRSQMATEDKIRRHSAEYMAAPNPRRQEQNMLMDAISRMQSIPTDPRDNVLSRMLANEQRNIKG